MAWCSIITEICFSVVLMGVAGTNCRFVHVDIGSYGKECDSTVFLQIYAIDINSDKYAGIIQ